MLDIIKGIVVTGFMVWLGHMTLMLYSDMQNQKVSVTEAIGLWIKATVVVLIIGGVIIY